jgi:hypothetical protein
MNANPQILKRAIPRSFNHSAQEWMPEDIAEYRTGWWEAHEHGVKALAQTREKAEDFVRFILANRRVDTEEGS